MLTRIWIAARDEALSVELSELVDNPEILVDWVAEPARLQGRLATETCDLLVVAEGWLSPTNVRGLERIRELPGAPEVVVLMESADSRSHAELMACGALAVLDGELPIADVGVALGGLITRWTAQARLALEARAGGADSLLSDFTTRSPGMRSLLRLARQVAATDASLLIVGETGVGKEFLTRAIHTASKRSAAPLVTVNCAALPEPLLESELFGHTEGAFTGATRARRGQCELAHRGTLFLDEIGELPLSLQAKLLRVLQEREIQPLGSETTIAIDTRVIAATHCDLEAMIAKGTFRSDLYYRLNVVTLHIPPLRERREDIPELVQSHVAHQAAKLFRRVEEVSAEALELMLEYSWPGNIRELVNVIERAVILCTGPAITPAELPRGFGQQAETQDPATHTHHEPGQLIDQPFTEARQQALDRFERRYLSELLTETRGRVGEASEIAGISTRGLYDKLQRLGLRKEDFRNWRRV